MSANNDVDLDDYLGTEFPTGDGQEGNAVRVLRQKLEAELKARKGLESELGQLRQGERQRQLDSLFEGVPAKWKKLYGERPVTAEAFAEFRSEYGELWGAQASTDAVVDPAQQQAAQAMQAAAATAPPTPVTQMSEDEARRQFEQAKNPAEVFEMLQRLAGG